MTSTALLPELARDSHLVTRMTPDYCVHFFAETPTVTRKEVWKRTKRIGAGSYGTVWLETCVKGQENGTDTLRAVKVLQLRDAQAPEAIARCGRELEALAKFSQRKYSKCFVKSTGWYEDISSISICLEYLPLGDLQGFLAKQADPRLSEPEAKQIVSQVLDGLIFMHAEGFAHRDLKPSNILIKSHRPDNWWVKLCDFGLSKRTEVTRGSTILQGTPAFMAPELRGFLANNHPPDAGMWRSADLWSLGEIAFYLVTGRGTFPNPGTLAKYARGEYEFPASELQKAMASLAMVDFVTTIMLADYTQRPTAETASAHRWLVELRITSLVMPSHVMLDSSEESSPRVSPTFDCSVPSIEYGKWSTVSSAPVISPQDLTSEDLPFLEVGAPIDEATAVSDTVRPPQSIPDQGKSPAANAISHRLSEAAEWRFSRAISVPNSPTSAECSVYSTPQLSPIASSTESSDQDEPDLEILAQRGLDVGTKWYSDAPYIPHTSSSGSAEELDKPKQLTTKVLTTITIDELAVSSPPTLAQIFHATALKGMGSGSHQVVFSPDSTTLATTSADNNVGLWSMEAQVLVRTIESAGRYVSFSPGSQLIATVKQFGTAYIMDAALEDYVDGPLATFRGLAEEARCVAFSPTGEQLVVGTSDGTLIIWDTTTAKTIKRIKAHSSAVLWVAYYPLPRRDREFNIVGGDADGNFRFWRHKVRSILSDRWVPVERWGAKGKHKTILNVGGSISAAAASKSFARLAVAMLDGSIAVWYNSTDDHWIEKLSPESVLERHEERINVMDFSPDSQLLASASSGSVRIWQVRGGRPVAIIRAPGGVLPRSVTFSPDSTFLAVTSSDDVVRLWNAEKFQNLSDVQDHLDRATFLAVSPDRRYIASVVRELRTNALDKSDTPSYKWKKPNKQRLPVDTDVATLMIWDVAAAKPLTLMSGHNATILSVSFSEDSRHLGSISADHVLRIWDIQTGRCLDTITSRTRREDLMPCAALSAGLRQCAAVFRYHVHQKHMSGFAISLCDIRLDAEPSKGPLPCKALTGTTARGDILCVVFSPDGKKLAAVDQDDNISLWDTASGVMVARLSDFTQPPLHDRNPFEPGVFFMQHLANYRAHMRDVGSPALQFVASGTHIALFSGLSAARFWNIEGGGQLLMRFGNSNAYLSDIKRKKKASESNGETGNGKHSSAFTYCSYSTPVAASPDGTRCVACSSSAFSSSSSSSPSSTSGQQQLTLWNVGTGEPVVMLADYVHNSDLRHVSFSPDSRWLVTASDKDMVVRDAVTGEKHTEITVGVSWPLRTVAFWPDAKYLVSGCYKGMLQFWDVESGAIVKALEGHTGRHSVAL